MEYERRKDTVIARVTGELDHCSAPAVRRELDRLIGDPSVRRLVLDLSGMTFMDSSGIGVILGRYREMRAARSHALGWRARAALKRARDYENGVLSRTGRRPSVADAAAHAGISPEELMLLEERSQPPVYDETGDLLSSLPDPRGEDFLLRLCIFDILDRLPRIEDWLLKERFVRLRTQQEIARRLHTRQYSVSRLEKRARQRFIREWES